MTVLERVTKVVAAVMRLPEVGLSTEARLTSLGETDSLTLAEIATALDAEFAIHVPSDEMARAQSIADLARVVERVTAGR